MTSARYGCGLVIAALVGSTITVSYADEELPERPQVALIGASERLAHAVHTALAPWRLSVSSQPDDATLASCAALDAARRRATGLAVNALAWIARDSKGHVLCVYDRVRDDVMTRRLSTGPPFDDATAASVALSLKTLLRHSELAPAHARLSPPRTPQPTPLPQPNARRERLPSGQRPWRFGAHAQGLGRIAIDGRSEPILGLGLAFAPSRWNGRYSFATALDIGLGARVDDERFDGRLSSVTVRLELRRRLWRTRTLQLTAALGSAVHLMRLTGRLHAESRDVAVSRLNPSFGLAGLAHVPIAARLHAYLRFATSVYTRRQSFLVNGVAIARTHQWSNDLGLGVRLTWR